MFFNGRNEVIKFVNDYASVILEAKRKAVKPEGLKFLFLRQMLQRFPIALAQLKAENTSENF